MTRFEKWDLGFKFFGALVAIIGIIFYFVDKEADRDLSKGSHAFDLVDAYNAENMLETRQLLHGFWVEHAASIQEMQKEGITNRALRGFLNAAISINSESASLKQAINDHVSFFDRVETCISNDVCASEQLTSNFCGVAAGVSSRYKPWIDARNEAAKSELLGAGLQNFLSRCAE